MGAEVIIKNIDKSGNVLPPEMFIPVLEKMGIISHLDFYILDKICQLTKEVSLKGKCLKNVTIYFSQETLLERGVVERMKKVCEKYKVSPSTITIGLSQNIANMKPEEIENVSNQMKEAGFGIGIELLVVKYSNIATLSDMKFDEVKIERSVVKEILYHDKTRKIANYIISILHGSGQCLIVSEGIGSADDVELMKEANQDFEQGCYLLPPVSLDKYVEKYL